MEPIAIELLNTRRGGRAGAVDATDSLASFNDVAAWAVRQRLLMRRDATGTPRAGKHALEAVLAMRSAFEQFLIHRNASTEAKLARELNNALRDVAGVTQVTLDDGVLSTHFEYLKPGPANVVFAVAQAILNCLRTVPLSAIKRCAAENCIWFFVDGTKNQKRRWCSSGTCGTRTRALRYYRKRSHGTSPVRA